MAAQKKPAAASRRRAPKAKAKGKPKAKVTAKVKAKMSKRPAASSQDQRGRRALKKPSANLQSPGDDEAGNNGILRSMSSRDIAELIEKSIPYKSSMRPAPLARPALRVLSWNVNGFAALIRSSPNAIKDLIAKESPDVLFLQETKLQNGDTDNFKQYLPDSYESKWVCSTQTLGYAGVAAIWRKGGVVGDPIVGVGLPEADTEGRCLTVELPRFYVVGCYVPNSGDGLKRLDFRIKRWEVAISKHIRSLQATKPVIYCGDLNVSHKELDLWGNHGPNSKSAGYTPQERDAMTKLLDDSMMIDTFRHKHPNVRAFTYWSYRFNARKKNAGWRLDYCLAPAALAPRVHDAFILPDVTGSDHCPVGLVLM